MSQGPVIDGTIVTQYPGELLAQGQYDHDVKILVGHGYNEGYMVANIYVDTEEELAANMKTVFPHMSDINQATLLTVLYPPIYDGSYGYTTFFDRISTIIAESSFICNANYLGRAFGDNAYGYFFDVAPGYHAFDLPYTFYNGPSTDAFGNPVNETVAIALQEIITSFAQNGDPNTSDLPTFPVYGADSQMFHLTTTGFGSITDTAANPR